MQKFKGVISLEELIKAIEGYRYLVELNLNSKGYTLENSIIAQNLNEQILKAKEELKEDSRVNVVNIEGATININAPVDVEKIINELTEKLKQTDNQRL